MSGMVESLNRAAAAWLEWTVASTGQGALLLLMVALILAAGRSLRPGLRYGLLLVVLLKFAVPPVFGVAYGFSDLLARAFTNESAPRVDSDLRVTVETSSAPSIPSPTVPVATLMPQGPVLSTKAWLLLLEAAGAGVIVFLIARQCLVARALIRNGAVVDEMLQERFHAMARSLKLRRTPRLRLSEAAVAPQSGGILRPFVILPAWAATMPEDELDILLAHELAHVRRMDALVNGLQAAAQALLWWNPAIWWLNRRIREEREFCCDDLVLSQGIASGAAYSRTLVNVAERVSLPQSSWAMAGMADNFGAIDRRVRRALEAKRERSGWRHYGALAVLLLVAGWVLPGATDGTEKEFDLVEAAKVESAYRIHAVKSERVGRNAAGAPLRSGKVSFTVRSSAADVPHLEVSATGEFHYPDAAGEAEKCVLTGEIKATHRDMSFAASRLEFSKDGVVNFGKATLDTDRIKDLKSERIVLDLRDGTLTMQDGKADEVNTNGSGAPADIVAEPVDIHQVLPSLIELGASDDPGSPLNGTAVFNDLLNGEYFNGSLFQFLTFSTMANDPERQGGVIFNDVSITIPPIQPSEDMVEISAGRLASYQNQSGDRVLEGDLTVTFLDLRVTASRMTLKNDGMLIMENAVLNGGGFRELPAPLFLADLMNGSIEIARTAETRSPSAASVTPVMPAITNKTGDAVTDQNVHARQISIDAFIVEIDRDAELNLPQKLLRISEEDTPAAARAEQGEGEGSPQILPTGTASDEEWSLCQSDIMKLVEAGRAKVLSSPKLISVEGEEVTIAIGADEPYKDGEEIAFEFVGTKLELLASVVASDSGAEDLNLNVAYRHTRQEDANVKPPQERRPLRAGRRNTRQEDVNVTPPAFVTMEGKYALRMENLNESPWLYFMPECPGNRLELVALRASVIQPGSVSR